MRRESNQKTKTEHGLRTQSIFAHHDKVYNDVVANGAKFQYYTRYILARGKAPDLSKQGMNDWTIDSSTTVESARDMLDSAKTIAAEVAEYLR